MKQTEKVNIGGFAFTIEQDAYEILDRYLSDIGNAYGSDSCAGEIMADIEERIAELLMEKCGRDKVVDMATVQYIRERIGSPADLAMDEGQNCGQAQEKTDTRAKKPRNVSRRLFRDVQDRLLGGVCSGISARLNIDPVFLRLAMAILFFCGFFTEGLLFWLTPGIYLILWIVIPAARTVEDRCRMYGKPIEISQFKGQPRETSGGEITTAPALHSAGRILLTIFGIILIICGISGLFGSTLIMFMHDTITLLLEGEILTTSDYAEAFVLDLITDNLAWWMITAISGLFSLLMLYGGTLLTFNFKAPKWKPGLIIFILWILSILTFAGLTISKLAHYAVTI